MATSDSKKPRGRDQIKWARKLSRTTIRQLYQHDAQGLVDEELIDEVAYGFYARCQSILTVTEASSGRIHCPVCDQLILRKGYDKEQIIRCPGCDWHVTWGAFKRTYKGKQLHGGGAVDVFERYVRALPAARSASEKMILIDWIVHQCHKSVRDDQVKYLRPVAVNLIEGSIPQVAELLQELAYGPGTAVGSLARRAKWRERVMSGVRNRARWLSTSQDGA
jgi:ribosomal protein L37AE/L43A